MEESDILQIARELGVEDEEIEELTNPRHRYLNPVIASILGFLFGFIVGMFFPRISSTYPWYRSFPPGAVLSKRKSRLTALFLGVVSLVFGFIISSQFVFSYDPMAGFVDTVPTYNVFTKRMPLNQLWGQYRKGNSSSLVVT